MKPRVYVTRQVPEQGITLLEQECQVEIWEGTLPLPRDVLMEKVTDIDGLYCLLTERAENLLAGLQEQRLPYCVNPDVY